MGNSREKSTAHVLAWDSPGLPLPAREALQGAGRGAQRGRDKGGHSCKELAGSPLEQEIPSPACAMSRNRQPQDVADAKGSPEPAATGRWETPWGEGGALTLVLPPFGACLLG